ncbi:hypothetical protein IAQ61_002471 [Plenodomus lingam]|uniref:uncharacterized protein n=1 Tax=Leptosphaeria maculans TaxID=5022 RepID=UPI003332FB1D|nr:hypothetical protein IAQ61_002471 [Plenodomus lingam]
MVMGDTVSMDMSFNLDLATPSAVPSFPDSLDFDILGGSGSLDTLPNILTDPSHYQGFMSVAHIAKERSSSFSPETLSPFAKSRVEYCFEQWKLAPKMMVEQNCTHWSHVQLYDDYMPRSMQDVHASCALYITRNGRNSTIVFQHIRSRLGELMATPIPSAPVDLLARAQALMLYQVMLVFGGDMGSYQQATDLHPHIEIVADAVRLLAAEQEDIKGPLQFYPSTAARAAWRTYIFQESLRRTLLSIYQIVTMYHLLNGQLSSCDYRMANGNRVTLSAHLWAATSAFDFAMAWNNKNHFLVKDLDFCILLRDAKPDDLDVFSKM